MRAFIDKAAQHDLTPIARKPNNNIKPLVFIGTGQGKAARAIFGHISHGAHHAGLGRPPISLGIGRRGRLFMYRGFRHWG